jgi:gamma-glutamyltranspeptidase/glutathione hydrolase
MLREGGSAVDAAIAAQLVLSLVEPQSSGIGGGGFLLVWDGERVQAWDGRETAPAAADERLFLTPQGQPMRMSEAVPGGRSVGVPGVMRMLETVHQRLGRLPWARLFEPAIAVAEEGFEISPRLAELLARSAVLRADPASRAYFFQPEVEDRPLQAWPAGHRLKNPAMADILRRLAQQGSYAFYEGALAADLVKRVGQRSLNPGQMSEADLRTYRAVEREPICTEWRVRWRICGMPPPSSGHLALIQILGILDALPPLAADPLSSQPMQVEWVHRFGEAAGLAFADRALYVADPAFVSPPGGQWERMLDPDYLRLRATLVGARARVGEAPAGSPGPVKTSHAPQPDQPEHGTSHLSVVDARGQAVAFTTSVEAAFGSGLLVNGGTGLAGGFLLNNQLTDFAFNPKGPDGRAVANRVEPGKRPRSSMSPTLVFERQPNGAWALEASLGSPGGPVIIHYVAKQLVATLEWGLTDAQAVALPNIAEFNGAIVLEAGRADPNLRQALERLGHRVVEFDLNSGLHSVSRLRSAAAPQGSAPRPWTGAADPRREGVVVGD